MYLKDQRQDFFQDLASKKYSELIESNGIVHIRKIGAGAHNAKEMFPMDNEEEEENTKKLMIIEKNGGVVKDNNIIQYFILRPLLLFNRKFNFRISMLIASINPLMAY